MSAMARTHAELQRLRRLVAFDRLLARLFFDETRSPWIVKGGYGLEVRYGMKARTTKDVDLTLPIKSSVSGNPETATQELREEIQEAAAREIGDFFEANIGASQQEFGAPPEGGARFPVEVRLDYRIFAKFHLDVGVGDVIVGEPDWINGEDYLSFAGIPPAKFRIIPIAQQFAEKIHSYTLPRARSNSRVKDLVDLVLILEQSPPGPLPVRSAVEATFQRRSTHPVPVVIPAPPTTWASSYTAMAAELNLTQTTVEGAVSRLNGYWKTIF
jgi:hypothetical protein